MNFEERLKQAGLPKIHIGRQAVFTEENEDFVFSGTIVMVAHVEPSSDAYLFQSLEVTVTVGGRKLIKLLQLREGMWLMSKVDIDRLCLTETPCEESGMRGTLEVG